MHVNEAEVLLLQKYVFCYIISVIIVPNETSTINTYSTAYLQHKYYQL